MKRRSRDTDPRSGFDVRKAGVGLTAAGRSAEVPRDAAIYRRKRDSGSINAGQTEPEGNDGAGFQ